MRYLFALVLIFSGVASAVDCGEVDFAGNFRNQYAGGGEKRQSSVIVIEQKDCVLTVYEKENPIKWKFDLSGKQPTSVPPETVAVHEHPLDKEFLSTTRFVTTLKEGKLYPTGPDEVLVSVDGSAHAPKEGRNPFDVNIESSGLIKLELKPLNDVKRVDRITVSESKTRLASVNDPLYVGPLAKAFLAGGNYVLEMADAFVSQVLKLNLDLTRE